MDRPLSLRTKGLIVASLPLGALLLATMLFVRVGRERDEADERLKRAQEIRAQLQNMFILLISAESEVRNYAVNGREEGLQPFSLVSPSIDSMFKKIGDLIQDNPSESRELTRVRQLVHQRLDGLKELRAYYDTPQTRGLPPPRELVSRAKISPDVIVALTEIFSDEGRRLQEHIKSDVDRRARLQIAMLTSLLLGFLGGVLAALLFTRGLARRTQQLEQSAGAWNRVLRPALRLSPTTSWDVSRQRWKGPVEHFRRRARN